MSDPRRQTAGGVLLREDGQGIVRLTLNRPQRFNALDRALFVALRDAVLDIAKDPGNRVLLLCGAGRGFCAGADLGSAGGTDAESANELLFEIAEPLILALRRMPQPVIAVVNGVAAGAGMSLALAADLVLAGESASFRQSFCGIGLVPDCGSSYFLPRLLGRQRALALALLGEPLTAQQAEQHGMVWKCVPDARLDAEAQALALRLANLSREALALTKGLFEASPQNALESQLKLEAESQLRAFASEDFQRALAAFSRKRKS